MEYKKISLEQSAFYRNFALVLFLLVATFSVWKVADTYARRVDPTSFQSFAVSGDGKVVAVPDVAKFTFSVITEGGKDLGTIQSENTKKMNAAVDFLKKNGVAEKDVKTEQYNVSPRYEYHSCPYGGVCPPPEIVGYTVSQSVLVKARDFAKVGELLSGVVKNGANSVSELTFSIDDPAALQDKAREEAFGEARARAEAVAKAGGFKLGKLLSIDEGGIAPMPIIYGRGSALGVGGDAAEKSLQVEPGSEDIVVSVTLRYEIKQ